MLSNRPYLLRAFYQWIVESGCTPILVIDAKNPRCKVPRDFAEGGEIVFNISSTAIRDLKIGNEAVEFRASFSGVIHVIYAPMKGILALYAEENGEGLFLDAEDDDSDSDGTVQIKAVDTATKSLDTEFDETATPTVANAATEKARPFLRLVE